MVLNFTLDTFESTYSMKTSVITKKKYNNKIDG